LIVEEIVKTIKADIASGKIGSHEKLLSERKLQELFGVGRGTVREAIKILEGMGLLVIKKGRTGGAFLTPNSSQIASESLANLFKVEESNVLAFIEFRKTMEPKIVFNAALNRTDANLLKLKEAINFLGRETRTVELYITATRNFFEAIAESTQNKYVIAFYNQLVPVLAETAKLIYEIPKSVDLSVHFYSQIYEAIVAGDPAKGEMISDAYLVQIENSVKNAKHFGVPFVRRNRTIKWGVILDLTSATLDYGKQCAMGMIDAARYLNENGGINGKKLELIIHDDKYELSEGLKAYKRFRDDEKILGIYIQSTGTNLSIAPMATEDGMFVFSGITSAKLTNPQKYPNYFSIGPTYSDMARAGIKFIRDTWTVKTRNPKLVFIFTDNVYGRDLLEAGKMYADEIGVEVGPDQIINWPTQDATPQLLLMRESDPDYAFITSTAMNAATILKDSKRLGIRTQFICNLRVFNEDLPRLTMGAAEGTFGVLPVAPYGANVPGMEKIVKCHDKWHPYHHPTLVYVEGWSHILVPMEGCKIADEAGNLTADGIKEAMETFRDFDTGGLVPPLSYFQKDHRATTQTKIFHIEKDRLSPITDYIDVGRDEKYFEI